MTTSKSEVLAAVPSLNDPAQPFSYAVEGDDIVGAWDIVRATTLYPTEVEHVDKKYRIVVSLDEEKSTFDVDEHSGETHARLDGGGLSFEKGGFSGKTTSKEFSLSFGGVSRTEDGVSVAPVVYSFSTAKIKDPLFGFLEQHGYHRKHGLLGRLFNH